MNAIEQMMQSFGANSAQSAAAFLGTTSASATPGAGFAEQFAAALADTTQATPFAEALTNGNIELYAVTNADAPVTNLLTNLSSTADPVSLSEFGVAAETNTEAATQVAEKLSPEGFQLVKVTPENFATLFGGLEVASQEGLSPEPQAANALSETQFFLIQEPGAGSLDDIHILPVSALEALLAPTFAAATDVNGKSQVTAATNPTVNDAAPGLVPTTPVDTPLTGNTAAQPVSQVTSTETPIATPTDPVTGKTLAERAGEIAAVKTAKDQAATVDIKIQKTTEAEALGVQAQQAVNAAKKAATANQAAGQPGQQNSAVTNQAATAAAAQSSANNQSGEQKQSKSNDTPQAAAITAAKAQAASMPQPASAPALPFTAQQSWTPERISGFGDGFSGESFAGGLSGLRGESSFVTSMGLLGGKPSPHMGGQIAKQLNLQVTNAVKNGSSEFTMRLDPAELGRVQVKMQFGADGKVAAQVMVERPETLELLQRETRGLERAIEAGGHKANDGGISFSLDTGDGESAGKAFAEALHQDRLKEQISENTAHNAGAAENNDTSMMEDNDLATLEEILSRVTPETGLDVRI